MNLCVITGTVSSDVELRETGNHRHVANFRIASTDSSDLFFCITAFEKLAEAASALRRGDLVLVSGSLVISTWKKGDRPQVTVEIIVSRIEKFGHNGANTAAKPIPKPEEVERS